MRMVYDFKRLIIFQTVNFVMNFVPFAMDLHKMNVLNVKINILKVYLIIVIQCVETIVLYAIDNVKDVKLALFYAMITAKQKKNYMKINLLMKIMNVNIVFLTVNFVIIKPLVLNVKKDLFPLKIILLVFLKFY